MSTLTSSIRRDWKSEEVGILLAGILGGDMEVCLGADCESFLDLAGYALGVVDMLVG